MNHVTFQGEGEKETKTKRTSKIRPVRPDSLQRDASGKKCTFHFTLESGEVFSHTPTFWRSKEGKACCSHALQCKQVTDEQPNISQCCSCCAFQGEQTENGDVNSLLMQEAGSWFHLREKTRARLLLLGRLQMTFWLTPGGKFDYFLSVSAVSVFKCSIVLLWVTLQNGLNVSFGGTRGPEQSNRASAVVKEIAFTLHLLQYLATTFKRRMLKTHTN